VQVITASVPQAELFSYATELRSLTGGRGTFSAKLDRYEDVPQHIAEKVIEAHRKEVEAATRSSQRVVRKRLGKRSAVVQLRN